MTLRLDHEVLDQKRLAAGQCGCWRKIAVERIEFYYPAAKGYITRGAQVEIVGSGDIEVLMQPGSRRARLYLA